MANMVKQLALACWLPSREALQLSDWPLVNAQLHVSRLARRFSGRL